MIQGWHNDDYLILFDNQSEAIALTERYDIAASLPGYTLLGLVGWDDFILRDGSSGYFTIPTVPLDLQELKPFDFTINLSAVRPDARYTDKIKWYIKPVIFGGDPSAESNMTWVPLDQHIEAVKWWNNLYRDLKQKETVA